jgi:hypothetical protein
MVHRAGAAAEKNAPCEGPEGPVLPPPPAAAGGELEENAGPGAVRFVVRRHRLGMGKGERRRFRPAYPCVPYGETVNDRLTGGAAL